MAHNVNSMVCFSIMSDLPYESSSKADMRVFHGCIRFVASINICSQPDLPAADSACSLLQLPCISLAALQLVVLLVLHSVAVALLGALKVAMQYPQQHICMLFDISIYCTSLYIHVSCNMCKAGHTLTCFLYYVLLTAGLYLLVVEYPQTSEYVAVHA